MTNNHIQDMYFEFKIKLDKIITENNNFYLNFTGHNNNNISCAGTLYFYKLNEPILLGEKVNWTVQSNINITSSSYTEGYSITNTAHVITMGGTNYSEKDLFLEVFRETSKNATFVSELEDENRDVMSNSVMKSYSNLIDELYLAVYIYPLGLEKNDPIISFNAPSFSNPDTVTYPEDNVNTTRSVQTRQISNIKGLNEEGKIVAEKLNALKETPKLIVDIVTGKGSDFYIGNYSWYFSDTEQFSNIESFDANFGASTYEYNMLCTDFNNIFGEGAHTAELLWTFPGAGEVGIDTFKVRFAKNAFK